MPDDARENTGPRESAQGETAELAECGEEQAADFQEEQSAVQIADEAIEEPEAQAEDPVDEVAGEAEDEPEAVDEPVAEASGNSDETEAEADEAASGEEADEELEPVEALGREESIQALHALLFASDRPVSAERLAEALGDIDREVVVTLLDELAEQIEAQNAPYMLRRIAGGYQLTTRPEYGPYIRRLFHIKKKNRLSKSVLETLAIIAYKQPVTRQAVEAIRGVSVSHAFEILQEKRLIKVSGVAELPGRPKLYRTTDEFLAHFGIDSLKGLPSIEEIREMG